MSDLDELRQLANLMADGTASPTDAARLSILLRDHPELRDAYLSYVDTHAALCWEFRSLDGELDRKADELAQLNVRLNEMNRLKSNVLASIGPELRTPLNSIIGFSEVLQGMDSLNDKQKRYAQNIEKSGRFLLEMINDILDLAKRESGKIDARLSELQTGSIILDTNVEGLAPTSILAQKQLVGARWLPWMMAVVATIVAAVGLLRPMVQARVEKPKAAATNIVAKSDLIAALLVDEAEAEFAEGRGPEGVRFGPGQYELLKGVIHLRFAQGADMVLAGPARLEVKDSLHARLEHGKVRVIAPPAAKGFTIATPAADYVDLGTEFGLRVEPESGASDLYVFDGQVNIEDPRSGKVLSEILEGKSARHVHGVASAAPELKENDFPNPGTIGFVRWQDYERRMRQDHGMLAFFSFRRAADEAVLVNSQSDRAMADGRITGARWASGRWPGKEALLFDRDSDFVQIEIPGEHQELTIATWLKLDRLDFELNAILNSDHGDAGDVHFQLTRQGLPRGGLHGPKMAEKLIGNAVPVGKWTHVALVISIPDGGQKIYVNGKLARDRRFLGEGVIRPGTCRIGNWLPIVGWGEANRALRGRIDELAIWNRALPEDELSRLVEAGRPGLLWGEETLDMPAK